MTDTDAPFRVLVVCTGNICRSPYTERLLRVAFARIGAALGPGWAEGVEVTSAGTHAMVGRGIEPPMAALAEAKRVPASGHTARQLDERLIDEADLVLAATRDHRRDTVRMLPRASRHVFALGEFARLLEDAAQAGAISIADPCSPRAALEEIVEAAASRRGFTPAPDDPQVDDSSASAK